MADASYPASTCPVCRRMDGGHDQYMHDVADNKYPEDQGSKAGPQNPNGGKVK